MEKIKILLAIAIIVSFSSIFINILFLFNFNKDIVNSANNNLSGEYKDCSGMDIFKTAECVNDEINEFYYYNSSNTDRDLTLEQLKEEGGVCWHYAEWYRDSFINYGAYLDNEPIRNDDDNMEHAFYVSVHNMRTSNDSAHEITILSNKEAFCVFSNFKYKCWRFSDG